MTSLCLCVLRSARLCSAAQAQALQHVLCSSCCSDDSGWFLRMSASPLTQRLHAPGSLTKSLCLVAAVVLHECHLLGAVSRIAFNPASECTVNQVLSTVYRCLHAQPRMFVWLTVFKFTKPRKAHALSTNHFPPALSPMASVGLHGMATLHAQRLLVVLSAAAGPPLLHARLTFGVMILPTCYQPPESVMHAFPLLFRQLSWPR